VGGASIPRVTARTAAMTFAGSWFASIRVQPNALHDLRIDIEERGHAGARHRRTE
jgi:hypothetical protein